jgi:hypothetical protein
VVVVLPGLVWLRWPPPTLLVAVRWEAEAVEWRRGDLVFVRRGK